MTFDRRQIGSRAISFVLSIAGLCIFAGSPAVAGLPDEETYNYVKKRYSLLVDGQRRSDCSRFARPGSVVKEGTTRYLNVLVTRGENDGTICSGAFSFQSLRVDCKTNMVAYMGFIATPFEWRDSTPYENPELARTVCSLP
jgi:hypothetical protein